MEPSKQTKTLKFMTIPQKSQTQKVVKYKIVNEKSKDTEQNSIPSKQSTQNNLKNNQEHEKQRRVIDFSKITVRPQENTQIQQEESQNSQNQKKQSQKQESTNDLCDFESKFESQFDSVKPFFIDPQFQPENRNSNNSNISQFKDLQLEGNNESGFRFSEKFDSNQYLPTGDLQRDSFSLGINKSDTRKNQIIENSGISIENQMGNYSQFSQQQYQQEQNPSIAKSEQSQMSLESNSSLYNDYNQMKKDYLHMYEQNKKNIGANINEQNIVEQFSLMSEKEDQMKKHRKYDNFFENNHKFSINSKNSQMSLEFDQKLESLGLKHDNNNSFKLGSLGLNSQNKSEIRLGSLGMNGKNNSSLKFGALGTNKDGNIVLGSLGQKEGEKNQIQNTEDNKKEKKSRKIVIVPIKKEEGQEEPIEDSLNKLSIKTEKEEDEEQQIKNKKKAEKEKVFEQKLNKKTICKQKIKVVSGNDIQINPQKSKKKEDAPQKIQQQQEKKIIKCTCQKSKCLKKYCACYAAGVACDPNVCECIDCNNDEKLQQKLKKQKIREQKKKKKIEEEEEVFKPCTCSGTTKCLKQYCICYSRGQFCTDECSCIGCQNRDEETLKKMEEEKQELIQLQQQKEYIRLKKIQDLEKIEQKMRDQSNMTEEQRAKREKFKQQYNDF